MKIEVMKGIYQICKVTGIPEIRDTGFLMSVTITEEEISVVCLEEIKLEGVLSKETSFRVFKVAGPLDFSLVGIIAAISGILAEAEISIFTLSTFNTDYILVKENQMEKSIELLLQNNYEIVR
ncbi:MAG: ACT domain-containing protein [Clostridia bacterium]|nr:ACT domain-containing protein [Clostridia bacterium]